MAVTYNDDHGIRCTRTFPLESVPDEIVARQVVVHVDKVANLRGQDCTVHAQHIEEVHAWSSDVTTQSIGRLSSDRGQILVEPDLGRAQTLLGEVSPDHVKEVFCVTADGIDGEGQSP